MINLDEIYSELILEYSRDKKHRGKILGADVERRGVNPSCGDDISVAVKINDGRITKLAFQGQGCAIAEASSAMMAELLEGRNTTEAREIITLFLAMIRGDKSSVQELKSLGNAATFVGIAKLPSRIKCAGLAWHTLEDALVKLEN